MARLNNKPLTQRIIDTTTLPKTGMIEMRDPVVRGLVVRIFPSGKRSFSLEFRSPVTKKTTRDTLSAITLAEARMQAGAKKVIIAGGRDPTIEAQEALTARQIQHARAKSVADALEAYERDFVSGAKIASRRERMAKLRRAVVASFHDRQVASLTKGELVTRLDEIQSESGPVARNRAQAEIRAWLGWLHDRDMVAAVVLAGVKKKGAEKARTRVLSDAELRAMLNAITDGAAFSDLVRVLLHTGMRKGEAANLQRRDLDFEARTITVRDEIAKNNTERMIPMAEAIAPMLQTRAKGLARDRYIFGDGSGFASPLSGWGKPTDRLRESMPDGDPWTLHDIRRTVDTRLHDAGVEPLVIEDLLGHISGLRGGVAGVYNRSVTLAKQAAALSDWAGKLASLAGANVVAFKRTV